MGNGTAGIYVGASPAKAGRSHLYLLFEDSNGDTTVLRGGPERPGGEAQERAFIDSTVFGDDVFGKVKFESGPYLAPHHVVFFKEDAERIDPIPREFVASDDPRLQRDATGEVVFELKRSPDWPRVGELHHHEVLWRGSDVELQAKLGAALSAGRQINQAALEYSPLFNNSNGVAGVLMHAAGVEPKLPRKPDGTYVDAPDFGERLYQHVGAASSRSGYSFDGRQWRDENEVLIVVPDAYDGATPVQHGEHAREAADDAMDGPSSGAGTTSAAGPRADAASTGDVHLDALLAGLESGDDGTVSEALQQVAMHSGPQPEPQLAAPPAEHTRGMELPRS